MGKFFRRLLVGAAVVWGVKTLQDKRRAWSTRPADEIRRDVMSKLPASMDEESKRKVADKVVQAVKGDSPAQGWKPAASPIGTTTPTPETPLGRTPEPSAPSTPPKVEEVEPGGSTTPAPPVEDTEERESSISSPPVSEDEDRG
ncbi:MAG: hypothetical protein FWJ92_00780 [Actinomycetes bacterium]|jgi:hypothetical protein|nr:hypothetical protein [Acidimicrobiia bacterium]